MTGSSSPISSPSTIPCNSPIRTLQSSESSLLNASFGYSLLSPHSQFQLVLSQQHCQHRVVQIPTPYR